ncbi:hypothetical protein BH10ACT2_BH10ACT2_02940 [soil metagenome]
MKQTTVAPQQPAVACARARGAFGMAILGFAGSTTATNLSTRRLGTRTT